jgi:hypothetical protein
MRSICALRPSASAIIASNFAVSSALGAVAEISARASRSAWRASRAAPSTSFSGLHHGNAASSRRERVAVAQAAIDVHQARGHALAKKNAIYSFRSAAAGAMTARRRRNA